MMHALIALALVATSPQVAEQFAVHTATGHAMRYLVSRPAGWQAGREYPTVVIVESANRDFAGTLREFARARGARPFLLLAPLVATNGGQQYRRDPGPYSPADLDAIDAQGPFAFDESGIAAMLADAKKLHGAADKPFLAAWEAGGHTAWALLFRFPERFRGAALATPNWQARWMDAGFSSSPARRGLPVLVLRADEPGAAAMMARIRPQLDAAVAAAREHGFERVELRGVDKPHGPLAGEALDWFASL